MNHKYLHNSFNTVQWFIFLLANAVALPIVVGSVFQLSIDEVSSLMQRTFFIVGISSFIQGWVGHKYPLADGPAGSWVSVFVILGTVAVQQGQSTIETLQILQGGLIVSAILLVILGTTGLVQKLLFLFTPLVTGSFLLILALQLSGVFMKGMIGLQGTITKPDFGIAAISFFVFILVILLSTKGKSWIKSYVILIGIALGWGLYALLGKASPEFAATSTFIQFPEVFAWGLPKFNIGIIITAILFTFLLVSNTVAAVSAVKQVVEPEVKDLNKRLNRGVWAGGISHFLASIFSSVGIVPLPVSAGFIQLSGQKRVRPFLIACLVLSAMALIPSIVNFLSLLPGPIASAALMATFVNMIGIAFKSIVSETLDQRRLTILGITLLISFGLMFLPQSVFQELPSTLQYIVSNGLLVGTIIVIFLEQIWKKDVEIA